MVIVSACRQVAGHETEGQVQRGRGIGQQYFQRLIRNISRFFFFGVQADDMVGG